MKQDPIVEEIRRIRDEYAKGYDYDIEVIVRALQETSSREGRRLVSLPTKPVMEPGEERGTG